MNNFFVYFIFERFYRGRTASGLGSPKELKIKEPSDLLPSADLHASTDLNGTPIAQPSDSPTSLSSTFPPNLDVL